MGHRPGLLLLIAALPFCVMLGCRPPAWLSGRGALDRSLALALIAPSVVIAGAAVGGTLPVSMELLAELSHPLPPGTSANAVVGLLQITATINTVLAAALSPADMNLVMLLCMPPCAALVWLTRERYGRSDEAPASRGLLRGTSDEECAGARENAAGA